jgi:hypothetical protein
LEAMDPAVTENAALLAPFVIATLAGVVRFALSSERLTVVPPTEALFSETVHDALWPLLKLPGVQEREERAAGEIRLMAAVRVTAAALAVMIADASVAIEPAVALNPTLV